MGSRVNIFASDHLEQFVAIFYDYLIALNEIAANSFSLIVFRDTYSHATSGVLKFLS